MAKNPFSIFTVPGNTAPSPKRVATKSKPKAKPKKKTSKSPSQIGKTTTASARRTKHKGSKGETAYGQRMTKSPIQRKKRK